MLTAVVSVGPPALGSLPPAAAASIPAQNLERGREVKVAIVRAPGQNSGAPDSLVQIAERTLGDPGRAQEIFDLNAGRRQSDGSALTDPATLEAGWILILPDDAQGPDVRAALLNEPADAANGSGGAAPDSGGAGDESGGEAEPAAGDAAGNGKSTALLDRLRWPIVLAVLGGLGVAVLTTAIVLRRRIRLRLRRLRALIRAARAWVVAGWRRRASLRRRSELLALWQQDASAGAAAAAAFRNSTSVPPAVAVSVGADGAEVLGHRGDASEDRLPEDPGTRPLPAAVQAAPAVARVGGDSTEQVFLDFTQCGGALGIEGDPALALDIARSVVTQLGLAAPQLVLLSLGPSDLPRSASVATVEDLDRFGLLPPPAHGPGQGGLITGTSIAQQLTGVLLIQPGRSPQELDDAVARCSAPGSGWIAVYPGSLRGARWRWTVARDGMLTVPILGRTLTAAGCV